MRSSHWRRSLAFLALAGSASIAFSQSPFVGKWKLDPSQSQLTGNTITFAAAPGGGMTETADGRSYNFKTDGQPVKTSMGSDAAWKQVDDHTWQSSYKRNGVDLGTTTWTLSPDGKSLTTDEKGTRPDGSAYDDKTQFERTAGQSGLAGTWRSTQTSMQEEMTMEFQADGPDGLIWVIPAQKATVHAKMDGKDYPATGPTVPDGITLSLTPAGANSFKMVEKRNGKELYHGDYTVAADGKTMTDVGSPAGVNEPAKEVWMKQ